MHYVELKLGLFVDLYHRLDDLLYLLIVSESPVWIGL